MRKVTYTAEAIEFWFKQMLRPWEAQLPHDLLVKGRHFYRKKNIRTLELHVGYAIVQSEERDSAIIDCGLKGLEIKTSSSDRERGLALGVAGVYEIQSIVAEAVEPAEGVCMVHEPVKRPLPMQRQTRPSERNVILKFFLKAAEFGFTVFWNDHNVTASLKNPLKESLTIAEREQIVRLLHLAKQQWFSFKEDRFVLSNLAMIPDFLNRIAPKWERYFVIEMPQEVFPLKQGVREIDIAFKASLNAFGYLEVKPIFEDGTELNQALLNALDQPQWIQGQGLVSFRKKAIESVKQARELLKKGGHEPYCLFSLIDTERLVLDEALEQWKQSLLSQPKALKLPSFLRPYQKEGVCWMHHLLERKCGVLLADEMGLGKTMQVLALLDHQNEAQTLPDLVVCPASVVSVWESEARRHFPRLKVQAFPTIDGKSSLWVMSYTQLRQYRDRMQKQAFRYIILDEAQMIKNPYSQTAQVCFSLQGTYRVALTGTPIENRMQDVWSLFHFLMPRLLGHQKQFQYQLTQWPLAAIRAQLAPFILRRTKQLVAKDLPEKWDMDVPCPLLHEQALLYQNIHQKLSADFRGHVPTQERFHFLALLMRLRLICCDPDLVRTELSTEPKSGKIQVLLEKLQSCFENQNKVVIFSQFVRFLRHIEHWIRKRWPEKTILTLTGESRQRGELVERFQNDPNALFLVSLRAGGTGITLNTADTVFVVDPWWNPAVEEQAIDRIHRIGQTKPVSVFRLITEHTVEAFIQRLKADKKELFQSLFAGEVQTLDPLKELLEWIQHSKTFKND